MTTEEKEESCEMLIAWKGTELLDEHAGGPPKDGDVGL